MNDEVREEIAKIIDKALMSDMVDGRSGSLIYADAVLTIPSIAEGLKLLELQRQGKLMEMRRGEAKPTMIILGKEE